MRTWLCSTRQGLLRPVIAFFVISGLLCVQGAAADPTPAPIAVPVSTRWYGDDGQWSPFTIRVGSPDQWLSVLPNTASPETWVVGPGGCDGTFTCQDKRGGLFFSNVSTTWTNLGNFQLNFDPQFGDFGYAYYGLDNVDLTDQIVVPNQVVGIINTTDFWLGSLGLGVQNIQFDGNVNHNTFLSSLVENKSLIPSHSYGYTAGAYYRLKNVPASLTLGGVDLNRYVPNSASFGLGPNQLPIVAMNSITVSSNPLFSSSSKPNWSTDSLTLLGSSDAGLFTIDSSTPFLWLPQTVCDAFAKALNLTYNDTLQLYTYGSNGTNPDVLSDWNISFTFNVADLPGSSNAVNITLPYAAFDLQLSYPFPNLVANASSPALNYFPLRRAANSTQFTIGRMFLQETYLTVDYERNNFSISQAKFAPDALTNMNLAAITRPQHSNFTGPAVSTSSGLSTGAKAGIGVGAAIAAIAIIAVILWFCLRRRRKTTPRPTELPADDPNEKSEVGGFGGATGELWGDKHHPTEIPADKSNTRFELSGSAAIEMSAGEVPVLYYAPQQKPVVGYQALNQKNNYRDPAELENPISGSKDSDGFTSRQSPSPSLPAYSPSQVGRPHTENASPASPQVGRTSLGPSSPSSSEHLVSPRTASRGTALSKSNRVSGAMQTPISPPSENTTQLLDLSNDDEQGTRHVSASHLAAPEPEQPARSPSRSSRFREDIDDDVGPPAEWKSSTPELATRPPELRRFSWEA